MQRTRGAGRSRRPLAEVDLDVPETLRQLIETQIAHLSVEEQRALEAASVQGAFFSPDICAAVINGDAEEYENLYDSMADRKQLMRVAGSQQFPSGSVSTRYEFVHALYHEVLYWRQSPSRRRTLHRRIGERLETLYPQHLGEVAAELAHHFEQSSDWLRTIKYLRLAAEAAERRLGHREAIALLERALSFANKLPADTRALKEIELWKHSLPSCICLEIPPHRVSKSWPLTHPNVGSSTLKCAPLWTREFYGHGPIPHAASSCWIGRIVSTLARLIHWHGLARV